MERIQKILSAAGVCSRRKAEQLILDGNVTVDSEIATLGTKADPLQQEICVHGVPIATKETEFRYILLHKPKGYLTSVTDDRGRLTVMDLLGDAGKGLWPVGRLDFDSEGLLLLTNDGDITQKLTHPSFGIEKTYHVTVKGEDLAAGLCALQGEIRLDDEVLNPAKVSLVEKQAEDRAVFAVTISQGKNRQVRRMCAYASLTVLRLIRVKEANLQLDSLKSGKWRRLTAEEVTFLHQI